MRNPLLNLDLLLNNLRFVLSDQMYFKKKLLKIQQQKIAKSPKKLQKKQLKKIIISTTKYTKNK